MQLFLPSSYRAIHKKTYENTTKANYADSLQRGKNPSTHLASEVKFSGWFDSFSRSKPAEREGLLATQREAERAKEKELRKKYKHRSPISAHLSFEEFKAREERHQQSLLEASREVEEERAKRREERQAIRQQREAERDNPQ